jgi:hypothetical protein
MNVIDLDDASNLQDRCVRGSLLNLEFGCVFPLVAVVTGGSRWPDWLKMKNPAAPAVKREAEEDWGR